LGDGERGRGFFPATREGFGLGIGFRGGSLVFNDLERPGFRVDQLRSPAARPFVLRAEELAKGGDPKQAKIQLVMAMHMDKGNPALTEFAKQLDLAIVAKSDEDKKSWKK
jgi:hypothetical protein